MLLFNHLVLLGKDCHTQGARLHRVFAYEGKNYRNHLRALRGSSLTSLRSNVRNNTQEATPHSRMHVRTPL
jgi:hypothetical protein